MIALVKDGIGLGLKVAAAIGTVVVLEKGAGYVGNVARSTKAKISDKIGDRKDAKATSKTEKPKAKTTAKKATKKTTAPK